VEIMSKTNAALKQEHTIRNLDPLKITNRKCCIHMWRTPMVRPSSDVVVCNYASTKYSEEVPEKDRLTLGVHEIKGNYTELTNQCQFCIPDHFLSDEEVVNYLKAIKCEHLMDPYLKRIKKLKGRKWQKEEQTIKKEVLHKEGKYGSNEPV
jgi:hypothetical protein